jgi:hypothetical protein
MHHVDPTGKNRLLMRKAIEAHATVNCLAHFQKMTAVAETTGHLEMIAHATMNVHAATMIATVETRTLIDAVITKTLRIAVLESLDGETTRSPQAGLDLPSPRKTNMDGGNLTKISSNTCRSSTVDPSTMVQTALEAHAVAKQTYLAGTTTL